MVLKSVLGFGMMRLPVKSDPIDFDYAQLNEAIDSCLDTGYSYFEMSFVHHNGKSEEAIRKAVTVGSIPSPSPLTRGQARAIFFIV